MDYKLSIKKFILDSKSIFLVWRVLSTRLNDLVFLDPKITNKTHLVRVQKHFLQVRDLFPVFLTVKYQTSCLLEFLFPHSFSNKNFQWNHQWQITMQDMSLCLFLPLLGEVLVVCVNFSSHSYHLWRKVLAILNQGQRALGGKRGQDPCPHCQGQLFFSDFLFTWWYFPIKENWNFLPVVPDDTAQGSAPASILTSSAPSPAHAMPLSASGDVLNRPL